MEYTKIKTIIFSHLLCFLLAVCCSSCINHNHTYKVSQADLYLKIQDRKDSLRIYVGRTIGDLCFDYIDIDRVINDMPGIRICFVPQYQDNLYLLDRGNNIRNIKEEKFRIINSVYSFQQDEKGLSYVSSSDSILQNNEYVMIELNAYIHGFAIWRNGNDYQGNAILVE